MHLSWHHAQRLQLTYCPVERPAAQTKLCYNRVTHTSSIGPLGTLGRPAFSLASIHIPLLDRFQLLSIVFGSLRINW